SIWSDRLIGDVHIPQQSTTQVATTISNEIIQSDTSLHNALAKSSPLDLKKRLSFFDNFQIWEHVIIPKLVCPDDNEIPKKYLSDAFFEMKNVVNVYMSFVFAGDGLFELLVKEAAKNTILRISAKFIRNNPLRAIRNAVAHGNYHIAADGSLSCWAKKGDQKDEPLVKFEASDIDMAFYAAFTRTVAWASLCAANYAIEEKPRGNMPIH
ncbi:hypothetical protein KJ997_05735, partial [bacterium]|nr:hypothetical protein [bacterium]